MRLVSQEAARPKSPVTPSKHSQIVRVNYGAVGDVSATTERRELEPLRDATTSRQQSGYHLPPYPSDLAGHLPDATPIRRKLKCPTLLLCCACRLHLANQVTKLQGHEDA